MNGVEWADVERRWLPFVAGSATRDELRRLLQLMIGELNASHLGVLPPPGTIPPVIGKTGVKFDPTAYESNGALTVSSVLPLSPAAVAGIQKGDTLTAIAGLPISRSTDFDAAMANTIGKRVVLRVRPVAGEERDVALQPIAQAQEKDLLYRDWVRRNREYVAKASGGRLGYIHMPAMSPVALEEMYLDIDAENRSRQGVVFDVRNNSGGFVAPYALDAFARRDFGLSQRRGGIAVPSRSRQGQPVIGVPTILVTNQSTLSDGEIFTQGYQHLKLGKVVGEPTAGWVIGTANVSLLDGTVFRLPSIGWTTVDGAHIRNAITSSGRDRETANWRGRNRKGFAAGCGCSGAPATAWLAPVHQLTTSR
jgi:C-terminal processing protease CtpA/Prc